MCCMQMTNNVSMPSTRFFLKVLLNPAYML